MDIRREPQGNNNQAETQQGFESCDIYTTDVLDLQSINTHIKNLKKI